MGLLAMDRRDLDAPDARMMCCCVVAICCAAYAAAATNDDVHVHDDYGDDNDDNGDLSMGGRWVETKPFIQLRRHCKQTHMRQAAPAKRIYTIKLNKRRRI